jgi:hypothetical protein
MRAGSKAACRQADHPLCPVLSMNIYA